TSSRPRSMPAGSGVSHSSNSRRRPNMISNQGLSSWPKKRHFAKLFVLSSSSCGTTSFAFFFFQAEDGIRDLYVTGVSDVCSSDLNHRKGGTRRAAPATRGSRPARGERFCDQCRQGATKPVGGTVLVRLVRHGVWDRLDSKGLDRDRKSVV